MPRHTDEESLVILASLLGIALACAVFAHLWDSTLYRVFVLVLLVVSLFYALINPPEVRL